MTLAEVAVFAVLFVPGFTACAEFGSYAFVHPVIRRLPHEHQVAFERGLLRTFGRVMPVSMTLSLLLVIAWASTNGFDRPALQGVAVGLWAVGLATTIAVNVGINRRTARGEDSGDPGQWRRMRGRWEWFQGFRSWAFLGSFAAVCAAVAIG